ncbi:MAG TPA: CmcJ/NvfI family oxidoreductase, partial [Candidatus Binatia bacterium]|nr:CmcJ/NvfI family oxidoreductase [Candidatus Binatia bacterium]
MSRPQPIEESAPAVEASLNYLIDTGEKPASYGGVSSTEADQKRKGKYQEYRMPVYDARGIADRFSLECEGFVFVKHETKIKDFFDAAEVRSVYYPETEQLVKKHSGAKRVLVFDHTLRSADSAVREAKQISGPVRNAHNDYTEWSGPQRVRDLLPEEAEELLKRRFAVIQTWRPIRNPVEREALAIADARSIGTKELIPSSRVYP